MAHLPQIHTGILSGLGKKLLLWFLLLALIPLSLISCISYLSARKSLIQDTTNHLSASLELKKKYIETFFSERIKNIELQSYRDGNIDFTRRLLEFHKPSPQPLPALFSHPDWQELEQIYRPDLDRFISVYGYHDILFIGTDGTILYSLTSPDNIGKNVFNNPELADSQLAGSCRRALEKEKTIVSDIELHQERTLTADSFLIRNLTDNQGRQTGLLAIDLGLEQIDRVLQDRTGLGKTGETFLIGKDLRMRSNSWKENGGKALTTKVNTDLTRDWLARHRKTAKEHHLHLKPSMQEVISYTDHRGEKVFGIIKELETPDVQDTHWAVIAEMSQSEVLALAHRLGWITASLFLATGLVVVLVSILIARDIVLPIRRVSHWAGLMAEGKKVVIEGDRQDNEIGMLVDSFHRMARSFQEITEVAQAIAVGDFRKKVTRRSGQDSLGEAMDRMVDNLQAVVRQAELIGQGDFSIQITPWSDDDQLGTALLQMTVQLRAMETANRKALDKARELTDHLSNLPTPVLTVNRNFKIQYINMAGAALAGLPEEECLGRYCYDLFHNDHCQTRECRIGMAMRTKGIETAETTIDRAGYDLPIRYTGAPVLDANGNVAGALEYIIDISETQNAFNAIETENWIQEGVGLINDRLRGEQDITKLCNNLLVTLAQRLNIPVASMYVAAGDDLRLRSTYSTTGESGSGRARFNRGEGLVGRAAREKQRMVIDDIPSDSIRMVSGLLDAIPKQLIVLPLLYEEQVKGVLELGTFIPFTENQLAFLDRVASHIAITISSIQSRNQLSELLAKTQQQAEELQSQQEELRVTNEELETQTLSLKEREKELQSQHDKLMVVNEELAEKTKSLEQQQADIQAKNQALENARLDLEKKAEELAIASKYKSEFLANMSHELRTPLNSLLLLSHNLAKNKEGNLTANQIESAEIMYNSGNDLLELINEILDLAKIEAGRVDLDLREIGLEELAARLKDNFQAISDEKGLEFSVILDPKAPDAIRTDRQRLEQILRNLVSNALKFTEQGGITISMRPLSEEDEAPKSLLKPDTTLAISITDTGIGIPEAKQKIIFEAFHQADGSTSRKYGGTGLGLSISRDLADLLGGEIKVTSVEGRGSTFTLYLPFAANERQEPIPAAQPASPQKTIRLDSRPKPDLPDDRDSISPEDKTILIVEDDVNFARTLLKQGRDKGFKCLSSTSGHHGLMLAEEFRPGAVILDINLPDMNGWEVLDALKKNPQLRHIPVHMMSVEEKTLDAYNRGAVGYLHKPVSQEELHDAFNRLENLVVSKIRELLIVEDDEILCRQIAKLIGSEDVNITSAATGAEAISILTERHFDCMILDIGLPDMTGFELLEKLDQESSIDTPPVIVYTGRELTRGEHEKLYRFTDSIIIKGVRSIERLLDETSLFLHRIVDQMPDDSRKMIANLYEQDAMFTGKKILIVDDDMRNAFALSKILSEKKMEILIANTGAKALDILHNNADTDLVLMDIMMPEMDGYEAMAAIRGQERFWNLPIIALTAKAMPEDKAKCLEAGANDYLAKPIEEARLLSMMRIWLYR